MARSCFAPSGNAERLFGNVSANREQAGADGAAGHYDDFPLCLPRKAEQTLSVPSKKTRSMRQKGKADP